MPIDRDMPLKEQMKFDIRALEVEFNEGDPQLDADGGATINLIYSNYCHINLL